ncbi:ARO8, Transcriptional regulator, partial [Pyrenophora tritici-repentis]
MPTISKKNSNKEYRKRIEERTRAGHCGYSLSCPDAPGQHTYCEFHRRHRATKQRAKRAEKIYRHASTTSLEDSRDVTRQAPSVPQAQAALPTRAIHAPNVSWQKLFWVSFPDTKRLDETATLAIQLFPEDRESLGHDPWLTEACSMTLHNTVIPSDNEDCFIHQGLVTALATKALAQISVDAHTWDWLATQLQGNLLSRSCTDEDGNALHGILFLHWTTNEPTNPTLDKVYSAVRLLKHIHPASFRVYPNENEAEQERNKLGDIRALDEVASSSPQEFSYRPRTCYGHGPCKLRDYQTTVHKRTQSGCATHVHVRERGDHHELTCQSEAQMLETTSQNSRGRKKKPIQEFVPSLQSCEFRVFIATEPSKRGIRGRIGQVIAIAKTSFNSDTQALAVREFLPEDLEPTLTRLDLVRFALFIFKRLRARPDSMIFFESLEVGVRLDIGVADTGTAKKAFFVNEIIRWYGAHYFSYHICAEPKTQICKAFAGAFAMVINSGTGSVFDISTAFNYGPGSGSAQLLRWITEHTDLIHNPPYRDWRCSMSVGNTSAIEMVFRLLAEREDSVLFEEYTFTGAVEIATPLGICPIGVPIDSEGLLPEGLDDILSNWDIQTRGTRKPHLLYSIPTGQNPTGATQTAARRRSIYKVCQKHDVLIIEDDPYYYLQMEPYHHDSSTAVAALSSHTKFLQLLVPSFLSMDTDGRVIRFDTFSKVVAPGSRIGWVTVSQQIIEKYKAHSGLSTQGPSGVSQLILWKLLDEHWGHAGYLDWLLYLRKEYTSRRATILSACEEFLPKQVVSWAPPRAGFFNWLQIDFRRHPNYPQQDILAIEEQLFMRVINH